MKEQLLKKLKEDDRNLTWFWKKHLGVELITYAAFFNQISGIGKLREDIKKIVEDFIK